MLPLVVTPVSQALFPKITGLVSLNKEDEIKFLFHKATQAIAAMVIPAGISIFIFSNQLIMIWTRNAEIALHTGGVLRFLILGNMFNCLMIVPYQYTISKNWTGYGIKVTIIALICYFPLILWAAYHYGIIGSAVMWMGLNALYLVGAMQYLFMYVLQKEKMKWYWHSVIQPLIVSVLCGVPFFLLNNYFQLSGILVVFLCGSCFFVCTIVNLLTGLPALKSVIKDFKYKYYWRFFQSSGD
jgi:O-antigen/teichoic acid export membrane protein